MVGRAEEGGGGGEKAGKYTAGIYNNTHVHNSKYTHNHTFEPNTYKYIVYVHVHVTQDSSFSFRKVTTLGVLCCSCFVVCMALLASFFLPSFSISTHVQYTQNHAFEPNMYTLYIAPQSCLVLVAIADGVAACQSHTPIRAERQPHGSLGQ